MTTYIAWPPDNARTIFPEEYWQGDPLDNYQEGIEQEQCPECDFTIQFISDSDQYENWNDHSHEMIAEILEVQIRIGDCPAHPKPNWMS